VHVRLLAEPARQQVLDLGLAQLDAGLLGAGMLVARIAALRARRFVPAELARRRQLSLASSIFR
jgi:hypothetical protein